MKKSLWNKLIYLFATQAGIGYLRGGGTIISAIHTLLLWCMEYTPQGYLLTIASTFISGYFLSTYVAKREHEHDPSCIVIDEVWGMTLALWGVPKIVGLYLLAFLLFRFFDIVKPYPISALEKLPDGWGIMLDDGLAGLCACIVVHGINYFFL